MMRSTQLHLGGDEFNVVAHSNADGDGNVVVRIGARVVGAVEWIGGIPGPVPVALSKVIDPVFGLFQVTRAAAIEAKGSRGDEPT